MGSTFIALSRVFVTPSVVAQPGRRGRGNDWARFWSKVDRSAGPTACWPWAGTPNSGGYGQFTVKRDSKFRDLVAHRWLMEQILGRQLDPRRGAEDACHYCNNPICCNPLHLYVDSRSGNMKYAVTTGRHVQSRKEECPAGHAYDEANTYLTPSGERRCRTCRGEQATVQDAARKAARTHCKNQHELSGDNLVLCKGGRRKCALCEADRTEKSIAGRKRQMGSTPGSPPVLVPSGGGGG